MESTNKRSRSLLEWSCSRCTFLHSVPSKQCVMCGQLRADQKPKEKESPELESPQNSSINTRNNNINNKENDKIVLPSTTKQSTDMSVGETKISAAPLDASNDGKKYEFASGQSVSSAGSARRNPYNSQSGIPARPSTERRKAPPSSHEPVGVAATALNPPSPLRQSPPANSGASFASIRTSDARNMNASGGNNFYPSHPHIQPGISDTSTQATTDTVQTGSSSQKNKSQGKSSKRNPFTIAKSQSYVPGPVPLCPEASKTWIYPENPNYELREYQLKITETALLHNTLVSLPTGLGKTLVAAVVLYNFYRWFPTGKVIFLAPTLPLVHQQVHACFKIMGLPEQDTALLTGRMPPSQRIAIWHSRRVFYCTPQTVQKDWAAQPGLAQPVVCIVLDEAHKASGDYAYTKVLDQLESAGAKFRVVGLSATPGTSIKAIQGVITALRAVKLEVRSEEDADVKKYLHHKHNEIVIVEKNDSQRQAEKILLDMASPLLEQLRDHNALTFRHGGNATIGAYQLIKAREEFFSRQPHGHSKGALFSIFHAAHKLVSLRHEARQSLGTLRSKLVGLRAQPQRGVLNTIAKSEQFGKLIQLVTDATTATASETHRNNPKLTKLAELLNEHFVRADACGNSSRAIVFSQFRDSVAEIAEMLHTLRPIVRPRHFVGQSKTSGNGEDGENNCRLDGMKQSEQHQVIKMFRENVFNVLVCTCIGEEGLDIGEVDLIVNYDMLRSPIRMIQRTGRTGRARDGRVVSLVSEGQEEKTYIAAKSSQSTLYRALKNPTQFIMVPQQPMFPNMPTLEKRAMQISSQLHLSQVIGAANSPIEKIPRSKKSAAGNAWKLTAFQEEERMQQLGPIIGLGHVSWKTLRRAFLRGRGQQSKGQGYTARLLRNIERRWPVVTGKARGGNTAIHQIFPIKKSAIDSGRDSFLLNFRVSSPSGILNSNFDAAAHVLAGQSKAAVSAPATETLAPTNRCVPHLKTATGAMGTCSAPTPAVSRANGRLPCFQEAAAKKAFASFLPVVPGAGGECIPHSNVSSTNRNETVQGPPTHCQPTSATAAFDAPRQINRGNKQQGNAEAKESNRDTSNHKSASDATTGHFPLPSWCPAASRGPTSEPQSEKEGQTSLSRGSAAQNPSQATTTARTTCAVPLPLPPHKLVPAEKSEEPIFRLPTPPPSSSSSDDESDCKSVLSNKTGAVSFTMKGPLQQATDGEPGLPGHSSDAVLEFRLPTQDSSSSSDDESEDGMASKAGIIPVPTPITTTDNHHEDSDEDIPLISLKKRKKNSSITTANNHQEESDEDIPLISLKKRKKNSLTKTADNHQEEPDEDIPLISLKKRKKNSPTKTADNHQGEPDEDIPLISLKKRKKNSPLAPLRQKKPHRKSPQHCSKQIAAMDDTDDEEDIPLISLKRDPPLSSLKQKASYKNGSRVREEHKRRVHDGYGEDVPLISLKNRIKGSSPADNYEPDVSSPSDHSERCEPGIGAQVSDVPISEILGEARRAGPATNDSLASKTSPLVGPRDPDDIPVLLPQPNNSRRIKPSLTNLSETNGYGVGNIGMRQPKCTSPENLTTTVIRHDNASYATNGGHNDNVKDNYVLNPPNASSANSLESLFILSSNRGREAVVRKVVGNEPPSETYGCNGNSKDDPVGAGNSPSANAHRGHLDGFSAESPPVVAAETKGKCRRIHIESSSPESQCNPDGKFSQESIEKSPQGTQKRNLNTTGSPHGKLNLPAGGVDSPGVAQNQSFGTPTFSKSAIDDLADTPISKPRHFSESALTDTPVASSPDSVRGCLDPEDIVCAVCFAPDSLDEDPIILCDGKCNLAFHQSCYGIKVDLDSDEDWFCDRCAHGGKALPCKYCSKFGGPLKLLPDRKTWFHPLCGDFLNSLSVTRCLLCSKPNGVGCYSCSSAAHPHCAVQGTDRGRWTVIRVINGDDRIAACSALFCPQHAEMGNDFLAEAYSNGPCCVRLIQSQSEQTKPRRRLLKQTNHGTKSKETTHLRCLASPSAVMGDNGNNPKREAEKRARQERRRMVLARYALEEADIDGDVEESDEEGVVRRIEEEELSQNSFINDSADLTQHFSQDNLAGIDPDAETEADFLHRAVDAQLDRENQFKTPILNRRMAIRGDSQQSSSSQKGLGNMHFVRSVLEHHRNGGSADEIESFYHKLAAEDAWDEGNQSFQSPLSPADVINNNSSEGTPREVERRPYAGANDHQVGPTLTDEQRARIERNRLEALKRRQRRINGEV